jgi:hypothetical protein
MLDCFVCVARQLNPFQEFILNLVLRYLSSNSKKIVYWVDTVDELSIDQASEISSNLPEDVSFSISTIHGWTRCLLQGDHDCLERIRWSLALEVEQLYDIFEEVTASAKVRTVLYIIAY